MVPNCARAANHARFIALSVILSLVLLPKVGAAQASLNYAMRFDGGQIIDILTTDLLRTEDPEEVSIGFWINLDPGQAQFHPHIMGMRNGCGGGTFFQIISYTSAEDFFGGLGGCGVGSSGAATPLWGEWGHVTFTFSASDGGKMYFNGELAYSVDCGALSTGAGSLVLGNSGSCPHRIYGLLDEVWFRDRVVSEAEIAASWNYRVDVSDPSLTGYWTFDERPGFQQVFDHSGNGHVGTLGSSEAVAGDDPHRVLSDAPVCDGSPQLSGIVRFDPFPDTTCDFTDPLSGWLVRLGSSPTASGTDDGMAAYTDASGRFSFPLVYGEDAYLSVFPPENWSTSCGTYPLEIADADSGLYYVEIGGFADDGIQDLEIQLGSSPAPRFGFEHTYVATYRNKGSLPAPPLVAIMLPDEVTPVSYSGSPSVIGQTVQWPSEGNLMPGEERQVSVTVVLDTFTPLGTELEATAVVDPVGTDFDPDDNTDRDVNEVIGSYDPNDKLVYSAFRLQPDDLLTYRIRFQNVGTAEAINVVVRDTLQSTLDLGSLSLTAASHPFDFAIEGRELIWTFEGIDLPDSTTNEPGSHGFVEFEVFPVGGLEPEDEIHNRAGIYFDFNPVVLTNTVVSEIAYPTSVEIGNSGAGLRFRMQSANPTAGNARFALDLEQNGHLEVTIHSVDGRAVRQLHLGSRPKGLAEMQWDGRDDAGRAVSTGVYFVRGELLLEDGGRSRVAGRLVLIR